MTEEEINDIELQVKAFLSLYRYSLWVVVGEGGICSGNRGAVSVSVIPLC